MMLAAAEVYLAIGAVFALIGLWSEFAEGKDEFGQTEVVCAFLLWPVVCVMVFNMWRRGEVE